jgi:hypothetical protein
VNDSADHAPSPVQQAEWHWLHQHLARDAVIVVAPEVDLAHAAARMAADDARTIHAWIESGQLTKPTAAQIALWNANPATILRIIIVQPYVLIQVPTETKEE